MSKEMAIEQVPCLEGWFTWPPVKEPHLLGSKCKRCGDYFFPQVSACGNPNCMSIDLEQVPLSRRGKLYSYTVNYFPAPAPYVPPDPFVPYAIGVMSLEKEKMKVLGQIVSNCDFKKLKIGMDIELVLETLYRDKEGRDVLVWKFKPS